MTKKSYVDNIIRPGTGCVCARVGMSWYDGKECFSSFTPSLPVSFQCRVLKNLSAGTDDDNERYLNNKDTSDLLSFFSLRRLIQFCMLHKLLRSRTAWRSPESRRFTLFARPYVSMYERASAFSSVNECARVWKFYIKMKMITLNPRFIRPESSVVGCREAHSRFERSQRTRHISRLHISSLSSQ